MWPLLASAGQELGGVRGEGVTVSLVLRGSETLTREGRRVGPTTVCADWGGGGRLRGGWPLRAESPSGSPASSRAVAAQTRCRAGPASGRRWGRRGCPLLPCGHTEHPEKQDLSFTSCRQRWGSHGHFEPASMGWAVGPPLGSAGRVGHGGDTVGGGRQLRAQRSGQCCLCVLSPVRMEARGRDGWGGGASGGSGHLGGPLPATQALSSRLPPT